MRKAREKFREWFSGFRAGELGLWLLVFLLAGVSGLRGQEPEPTPAAVGVPVMTFTPAGGSRTYMNVGKVWNADAGQFATHDTFTVVYTNTGEEIAYDFTASITLPEDFVYVSGETTVNGVPVEPALESGNYVFAPVDLGPSESLTIVFGLATTPEANKSPVNIIHRWRFSRSAGGLPEPEQLANQPVEVRAGDSTLSVTPSQQTRAVGDWADFVVEVKNTGFGALFDVVIDESLIHNNPSSNLQLDTGSVSRTSSNPLPHATGGNGDIFTIPYLGPGESFTLTLQAIVLDCGSVLNRVRTTDLTGRTETFTEASVALDLSQPIVSYSVNPLTLEYQGWTAAGPGGAGLTFTNDSSAGNAHGFRFDTSIDTDRYDIELPPGSEWSHADGTFTYHGNGGVIESGQSVTLNFNIRVKPEAVCSDSGASTVFYQALYNNSCGDPYTIPLRFTSILAAPDSPSVNLSKAVSDNRIAILNEGSYTFTLSASNREHIASGTLAVTDTLPEGVVYKSHNASNGNNSAIIEGQEIRWDVSTEDLESTQTLTITFEVANQPCLAGEIVSSTATVSATSISGCDIGDSAGASFLISNNPNLDLNNAQFFNVVSVPAGGFFETGNLSTDSTRNEGEGEFISFEAGYSFGKDYPGSWTGAIYEDDFAGVPEQTLVPGSLEYSYNRNGAVRQPVPPENLLPGPGLRIDLGFLGGSVGDGESDAEVRIYYQTTIPDEALNGGTTRSLVQRTNLILADLGENVPGGICEETAQFRFTQGAFYTVGRASASIGISEIESQIELCGPEFVTITVDNVNDYEIRNAKIVLELGGTKFIRDTSFEPVLGGAFNIGNIEYTLPGDPNADIEFTYTGNVPGDTFNNPLPNAGTIRLKVIRQITGDTDTTGFTARVDYDSWDTAVEGNRVYSATATYTPQIVHKANLAVTVTPGTIAVTGSQIRYLIYISNTDAGRAYGATVETTLPPGFTVNEDETNAANGSYPVSATPLLPAANEPQILTWHLGDVVSGAALRLTVIADVGDVEACEVANPGDIAVSWGCGGEMTTTTKPPPSFFFPPGKMQVLHVNATTATFASLCDDGKVSILVRNTGSTVIANAKITEIITGAGISYKAGSTKVNDVSLGGAGDPSIDGGTHVWTAAEIDHLALIEPGEEIRIDFEIATTEAIAGTSPTLSVSATAEILCGAAVASVGESGFPLHLNQPRIVVTKVGRNLSAGQTNFSETVYGGQGDTIIWQITVENTGNAEAMSLRLSDELSGTGGDATIYSATDPLYNTPVAIASDGVIPLSSLGNGASRIYIIEEILKDDCGTAPIHSETKVTWGCGNLDPNAHSNVSSPGSPTDRATLVVAPTISGGTDIKQEIEYLPGGRAKVVVDIFNRGGNAHNLVVTNAFPNGDMKLDMTVAPVVDHTSTFYPSGSLGGRRITAVNVENEESLNPKFQLEGNNDFGDELGNHMVRYGDRVLLTYYVRPTVFDSGMATEFPALGTPEKDTLDPVPPGDGQNVVELKYNGSCTSSLETTVTDSKNIDLKSPNLDIVAFPAAAVVVPGSDPVNYDFQIRNVGDPESIANFITIVVRVGKGWTGTPAVTSPAGTAIAGLGAPVQTDGGAYIDYTFTLPSGFTLTRPASGDSPVIRVRLNSAPADNGYPLMYQVEVYGEARGQNGASTGDYYSRDRGGSRIIGVDLTHDILSTSEPDSSEDLPATASVLIGEEITYRIGARFFGAQSEITNLIVRDTHGDTNNDAHLGLGYVNHITNPSGLAPTSFTAPVAPVGVPTNIGDARVSFNFGPIDAETIGAGDGYFETDFTVRVLNIPANTEGKSLRNNLGIRFNYRGAIYRSSNNADDDLSVPDSVSFSTLQRSRDITVRRPALQVVKEVRNRGPNGTNTPAFVSEIPPTAPDAPQAGDVIEYRITVTGIESVASIYDLVVEETAPAKIILKNGTVGLDTNYDGTVDVPLADTLTFSHEVIPELGELKPGEENRLVFLYQGELASTAIPLEEIESGVTVVGRSLSLEYPALTPPTQSAPKGVAAADNTSGTARTAARTFTATDTAKITAASITVLETQKRVVATSEGNDIDSNVQIGEQIRYEIGLILPQGTVPKLRVYDDLPAGLALVHFESVSFGNAIDSDSRVQPNVSSIGQTPIAPVTPLSGNPLNLEWQFADNILVNSGTAAERTIIIRYVAQVRNIAGNTSTASPIVNQAAYSFADGVAPPRTDIPSATVTVVEPDVSFTVGVRNATRNPTGPYVSGIAALDAIAPDAGDIIEFQISIANGSGARVSTAYDIGITETIPDGLEFVAGGFTGIDPDKSSGYIWVDDGDNLWPTVNGQELTWDREVLKLDLPPGATFTFHYRAEVQETGVPLQVYTNSVVVDWTSLKGAPGPELETGTLKAPGDELGERNGEGTAPNSYRSEHATTVVARNSTAISKTKSGDTLPVGAPADGFRIGDLVTYTLTLDVQEGTLNQFRVEDELPAGLAFVETISILPETGSNGFSYVAPIAGSTGPAENTGVTGTLVWDFGKLVNEGDNNNNDTLTIVYTARVLDADGVAVPTAEGSTTTERTNAASVSFEVHGGETHTTEEAKADIDVMQPRLTVAKDVIGSAPVVEKIRDMYVGRPGDEVTFEITITNTGTAPAYDLSLTDILPEEMLYNPPSGFNAVMLNDVSIKDIVNPPVWNSSNGEWKFDLLSDSFNSPAEAQPILPGKSLVLQYTVKLDDDAPKGATLTNTVTVHEFFSKPGDDLVERRKYAEIAATAEVVVGLEVTGFVYNDTDPNGSRDHFEDWTDGESVFVNLVYGNTVVRSTEVQRGPGDYILTRIPPGDYRVVVADNATATTGKAPDSWIFRAPPDGARPVTLTTVDWQNQDFGLYKGIGVTGQVFRDDGAGGGIGNNGIREGGESGLAGVVVRLTDGGGTVYGTAITDGMGQYRLFIPDAVKNNNPLAVEAVLRPNHIATGASVGNTGGTFDRSAVRVSFTYSAGSSFSGIDFGMVPENALLTDGQQTILPGTVAFYRHTFVAGSAGEVMFSVAGNASPSIPWSQVLIHDKNGDGVADGGDPAIVGPIAVEAGEEIHLILRESSPLGAPFGAINVAVVTAVFEYTNAVPGLQDTRTRQDITTIGAPQDAGLQLIKEVDETSALPGATLTYTITYRNVGTEPVRELVINDRTPHYTVFVSAEPETGTGSFPEALESVVLISPNPNGTGAIQWTFTGELAPGASGSVKFTVKILD